MTEMLTRRSALRGAAIVVVGGVVGWLVARNSDAAKAKEGTTAANAYGAASSGGGAQLASLSAIPNGGGLILSGPKVVLVRGGGPGEVHAFSAICTHEGCPVNRIADETIDCPCHGSRFDLKTGAVVAGPAPRPLPSIAVKVRDGEVYRT